MSGGVQDDEGSSWVVVPECDPVVVPEDVVLPTEEVQRRRGERLGWRSSGTASSAWSAAMRSITATSEPRSPGSTSRSNAANAAVSWMTLTSSNASRASPAASRTDGSACSTVRSTTARSACAECTTLARADDVDAREQPCSGGPKPSSCDPGPNSRCASSMTTSRTGQPVRGPPPASVSRARPGTLCPTPPGRNGQMTCVAHRWSAERRSEAALYARPNDSHGNEEAHRYPRWASVVVSDTLRSG